MCSVAVKTAALSSGAATGSGVMTADTYRAGKTSAQQPVTQGLLPAATMAEQTNIFLTDNRAT